MEETTRNLVSDGRMTINGAATLAKTLRKRFPSAEVPPGQNEPVLSDVHPKDMHVAVAAIAVGAKYLVTSNLRDFSGGGPDDFLMVLYHRSQEAMLNVVRHQHMHLRRPPVTMDQLLQALSLTASDFVSAVRPLLAQG